MTQPSAAGVHAAHAGHDAHDVQEDLDPRVVEHVEAIRDRFGLRGLRGAAALIANEVRVAEEAMKDLPTD